MVAAAKERGIDAVTGDLRDWKPQPDTDVVVSNAALHWVPEHADLLLRWAGELAPGSWIGVQMPGNFESPSYAAVRALARREPYAKLLRDIPFRVGAVVQPPAHYANLLLDAGCRVDVWETTYLHQLTGEHPVLEWITGTALVPVRERLDDLPVPAGLRRRRGGRRGPRVAGRHHRTSRDYRCAGLPSSMPRSAAMADRGVGLAP
jgi:trans-aconitate 2-methyltransferase